MVTTNLWYAPHLGAIKVYKKTDVQQVYEHKRGADN